MSENNQEKCMRRCWVRGGAEGCLVLLNMGLEHYSNYTWVMHCEGRKMSLLLLVLIETPHGLVLLLMIFFLPFFSSPLTLLLDFLLLLAFLHSSPPAKCLWVVSSHRRAVCPCYTHWTTLVTYRLSCSVLFSLQVSLLCVAVTPFTPFSVS